MHQQIQIKLITLHLQIFITNVNSLFKNNPKYCYKSRLRFFLWINIIEWKKYANLILTLYPISFKLSKTLSRSIWFFIEIPYEFPHLKDDDVYKVSDNTFLPLLKRKADQDYQHCQITQTTKTHKFSSGKKVEVGGAQFLSTVLATACKLWFEARRVRSSAVSFPGIEIHVIHCSKLLASEKINEELIVLSSTFQMASRLPSTLQWISTSA